ncbi:DUF6691 family protein [Nitratireductor rhodophyticola]|uniref:DUF6691 family protein n=1 Tax=Nitratireductor rhodophyticola TaxID=2854036 RepID=UPI002AC9D480|nr:DUF6691 family protein [Nitratireductor rhodophyticola]MEC9244482.1 DUF6691 family protein [Pseudomonadota bacterium]WPZ14447.1 DUF6691 family protein [Nitratireductor rhodophyticola]
MKQLVAALVAGLLFGAGIALSGMINPAKVLNFFDLAGTWDPSLAFVMGGGLAVAALGYSLLFGTREKPFFAERFQLPTRSDLDPQLVGGAAVFGIGWGIAGFCPGAAIPALGLGYSDTIVFLASLIAGILVAKSLKRRFSAAEKRVTQ